MKQTIIKEFEITKNNIDHFVNPDWQRIIRRTKVKEFEKVIEKDNFFSSVITINKLNNKFRIINGNHRINAIRSKLDDKPVKVILEIFENLNENEEREIFNEISIETPQSINDYLYIYRDQISFWKMVKEDFPVSLSIYPYPNGIRLKTIIDCYFSSINDTSIFDIKAVSKDKVLGIVKKMDHEFYLLIYEFFKIYKESIGDPRDNSFYKPIILVPLLNIFIKHKNNILLRTYEKYSEEDWKNLFKKIITDHLLINYSLLNTSREIMKEVRERILFISLHKQNQKSGLI